VNKKILLIISVIAAASITALIVFKIILANSPCPAAIKSAPEKIVSASGEEEELYKLASRYESSGDLLSLRDTYQKIMEKFPNSKNVRRAQEGMEDTNIKIISSSIPTPDSVSYEVEKGDTLARIAKKFSTTQDLIMKSNNIKNAGIVPLGRKLKIHNEKMSIVVDKSQNILTLKSDEKILKTYRISTGLNNCTPLGTFKIINKIVDPPWYTAEGVIPPDSPKNILGSRWLGISAPTYGIHGTTEPESIGKQITSGCVRMKNSDIEELYSLVPEGTEVVIVD